MNLFLKKYRYEILLIFLLLAASALRLTGLSYQSLWLDELHLMNEADPSITWKALYQYLHYSDLQPPVYFVIERTAFSLLGYNEWVARLITALGGIVSVWVMYLLGKEVLSKRLGLICAALTCFNYYNIYYSQEARPYIFSFLFAALSFTFFLRVLKNPSVRNGLWYAFWTLVFLYTHYFSLFAVSAQGLLALIFLLQEKGQERKKMLRTFFICGVIIIVGYAFWVPVILQIKQTEQTWIPVPQPDFLFAYFKEYFGGEGVMVPLLLVLMIAFFAGVAVQGGKAKFGKLREQPLLRCFVVVLLWILISYLVPYVRSVISVPVLYPRYTIVVLPALIIIIAYGIELFKMPLVRYLLLGCVLAVSFINLVFVKQYYTAINKTQFREMTQFLVKENLGSFPVINEISSWQQGYYLRKYHSKAEIWAGKKEDLIDSIVQKRSAKYNVSGFWIVGAHNDKKPDSLKLQSLNTNYKLVLQKDYYDAWAMFYRSK